MAREDVVESVLSSQRNASNGKYLDVQPTYEENSQEEYRETGLKALPAEEKARIGQLIKLLAQERRDKNVYRQKLDEQTVRLQALEQESQIGAKESQNQDAYRKKITEQNARLRALEKECELGAQERLDKEAFRKKVEEQSAMLRALEQECKKGAQELCEQEAYRQKIDEQNAKLESLEQECAIGRQQEQELLSRVSRSLHLLRSYQRELYMTKGAGRSEEKKVTETARNADVTAHKDVSLDRRHCSDLSDPKGQDASTKQSASSPSNREIRAEIEKVQVSVQTNPWHGDSLMDKCSKIAEAKLRAASAHEVGEMALAREAKLRSTPRREELAGNSRLLGETTQTSAQTSPLRETPLASTDPSDDVFTFGPLTHRHDARIRSRSPTGLRNMLSRFHSPRPPSEPVQSLSPPPRAGGSRSNSHASQHQGLARSLEPLVQSPPPRHVMPSNSPPHQAMAQSPSRQVLLSHSSLVPSPKPHAELSMHAQPIFQSSRSRLDMPSRIADHSPMLRLEPPVHSLWPLPLAATDAPRNNQTEPFSEPLTQSLDSPRVQRCESAGFNRTSWPSVMPDGYYPSSMFDVLDSVESALSQGSSSLSQASSTKTATFGRSSSELSRLQKEITALELQVFGEHAAETTGSGFGTKFHPYMDSAIAALNGAPMGTSSGLHAVSTEALARGMAKGKAITKSMPA